LHVNQDKRPTVEDLLNLPQVSLRLRERRLKDTMAKLKKIEETLKQKETELNEKEIEIKEKEKALNERENLLNQKEIDLNEIMKKIQMMEKENEQDKNNKKYSNTKNSSSVNIEDKYSFSDKYNLPLQIPTGIKMIPKQNKHELESIANSFNSQINQTSLNLNYLNLLNSKENININYNINNKINFENNFEMYTERTNIPTNLTNGNSTNSPIYKTSSPNREKNVRKEINPSERGNKTKENLIPNLAPINEMNGVNSINSINTSYNRKELKANTETPISTNINKSNGNYDNFVNNRNFKNANSNTNSNFDIRMPELNSSKHSFNRNSQNQIEINSRYLQDSKVETDQYNINHLNSFKNNNEKQFTNDAEFMNGNNSDKNFNFDPSLYKENKEGQYLTGNNLKNTKINEFLLTPKSRDIQMSSYSNTNIGSNFAQNVMNGSRENLNFQTNYCLKSPNRMILTASPVLHNSKNYLSKNNTGPISQGENITSLCNKNNINNNGNNISTVISTPMISNRLSTNHLPNMNAKSQLQNPNNILGCNTKNQIANINKYSSILTRDNSFSPSVVSQNLRKKLGEDLRPPKVLYK